MTLELKGKIIAEKTFKVHMLDNPPQDGTQTKANSDIEKVASFWKKRGL